MGIEDFLNDAMGNNRQDERQNENKGQEHKWGDIIKPPLVACILGKVGSGKSALAYTLAEKTASKYGLLPVVVNLPSDKKKYLPENWVTASLEEAKDIENSILVIDEGTTLMPSGSKKLADMVKGFLALRRQKNQLVILIFHASSDVDARILRGVDTILLKKPSKRQLAYGAKDNWMSQILNEARRKFDSLAEIGEDERKYTYVDSEEPEFQGLLQSGLCSFWTEELSKAFAGNVPEQEQGKSPQQLTLPERGDRIGWMVDENGEPVKDENGEYFPVNSQMRKRAVVLEEYNFSKSRYMVKLDPITDVRWIERPS